MRIDSSFSNGRFRGLGIEDFFAVDGGWGIYSFELPIRGNFSKGVKRFPRFSLKNFFSIEIEEEEKQTFVNWENFCVIELTFDWNEVKIWEWKHINDIDLFVFMTIWKRIRHTIDVTHFALFFSSAFEKHLINKMGKFNPTIVFYRFFSFFNWELIKFFFLQSDSSCDSLQLIDPVTHLSLEQNHPNKDFDEFVFFFFCLDLNWWWICF